MKYHQMTVAQVQAYVQRRLITADGEPYKVAHVIGWIQHQVERGRLPDIKVTPSRNKREGKFILNSDTRLQTGHMRYGKLLWPVAYWPQA